METTQTSQSLYQALWNSADVLRSKMDANDYKSYLLGMVFYKYLSDKMLFFVAETMEEETESLEEALAVYRKYYEDEETHEDLIQPSGLLAQVSWMILDSHHLGNWHLSLRLILPSSCMVIIT